MIRVAASPAAAPDGAVPDAAAREVLRLEGVGKTYGDVVALDQVGLAVMSGTILGIIGPSGAGKTTMIRILTGSVQPTRGKARVLGQDPRRFGRRVREQIGYMPQLFTLYPDLTASENVDFVASLFGLLWFRRRQRVREVLQTVDLWDARNRRAGNLSGGQQRRLELACALVHDPQLYFLDEPTAGIDPILRARIWEELHRLKAGGRTLLVTTQYVNEAEECDTVALIAEGGLIALATPAELRRQATGGDVVEIETTEDFDPRRLGGIDSIRNIERVGSKVFHVVVDDAGTGIPDVVEAVRAAGGEVAASREYRISFDEVFAQLVGRRREERRREERHGEERHGEERHGEERHGAERPEATDVGPSAPVAPAPTPVAAASEPPPPDDEPGVAVPAARGEEVRR